MKKIVFQGDSITDMERSRTDMGNMGIGYPTMVAGCLGATRPGEFSFLNKGIGGNTVADLLARVKRDVIGYQPDYVSILVGVNDVWHDFVNHGGVSEERFLLYYDLMLNQLAQELPDARVMLLGPFLLHGSATDVLWEQFRPQVERRAELVKKIAKKHGLVFVPLLKAFDEATKFAPADYWLIDGVHPTAMGHGLITKQWLQGFEALECR